MSNFHINPETGKISRCTASTRACKYGGASGSENHYESKAEAQKHFEKINSKNVLSTVSKKKFLSTPFNVRREALIKDFKSLLPNVEIIENVKMETLKKRNEFDFHPRKDEQVAFKLKANTRLNYEEDKIIKKFAKDNNLKIHQLADKDSRGYYKSDNLVFTSVVERAPQELLNEMVADLNNSKKRIGEPQPPYTTVNFESKREKILMQAKNDFPDVTFTKVKNNDSDFKRVLFKTPENTKGRHLTEEEAQKIAKDNDLKYSRSRIHRRNYSVDGNSYEFYANVHKTPEEIVREKEAKIKEFAEKNELWNY